MIFSQVLTQGTLHKERFQMTINAITDEKIHRRGLDPIGFDAKCISRFRRVKRILAIVERREPGGVDIARHAMLLVVHPLLERLRQGLWAGECGGRR